MPGVAATRRRISVGMRRSGNWLQLVRFVTVGASGFAVNVGTYSVAVHAVGLDYRLAAFVALLVAVANNFFWHRHWTFGAHEGHAGFQAVRFTAVYGVTFLVGLGILQALVSTGTAKVLAQALSQALITPLNFLGHRLWSFKAEQRAL